jgi:hypothetical protein
MKFQNFSESVPEAVPEAEEQSESDPPAGTLPFNNLLWCCSLLVSLILGIACLTSYPEVFETDEEVYIFTALYVSVEAVSGTVALLTMGTCFAISSCMGKSPRLMDYIGPFSVCTFTTSYIAHVLALPVTLILLYNHPNLPLLFQLFVGFECIISAVLVTNLGYRMATMFPKRNHQPNLVTDSELEKIRAQIKEARSRSTSLAASEPSRTSHEGREMRSTSSYMKRDQLDFDRKRSNSDYKLKLSLGVKAAAPRTTIDA